MNERSWPPAVTLARLIVSGFCWLTAAYAFVASSAFAYLQFIRPRVFPWIGHLSDAHASAYWGWFLLLVLVLRRDLRAERRVAAWTARALFVVAACGGLWNTLHPVLPSLHDGARSLATGAIALVPVLWLAAIDHLQCGGLLRRAPRASERDRRGTEGRLLVAAGGSALVSTFVYALIASWSVSRAFEPDLMTTGLALGLGWAVLEQALLFLGVFVALAILGRLSGGSLLVEYLLLLCGLGTMFALLFVRLVADPVGLTGPGTIAAAAAVGVSIAGTWGGLRLRGASTCESELRSAIDVFASPPPASVGRRRGLAVAAVLPLAVALAAVAARVDWDFVLLKTGVYVVWIATFVLVVEATPLRPDIGTSAMAAFCGAPLLVYPALPVGASARHTLDRYAVHNASFFVADNLVREKPQAPSFERYLRAYTGLTDISVNPVPIDFVPDLKPTAAPTPLVFLLVVDSLRADYLSPYNPEVTFTPRIQEFASRNLWFANAFTRYGGTGLSMPAIWAGSVLAHKQYVEPFAPMNALEKVLDANSYQRAVSPDHITEELWRPSPQPIPIDRGRDEMRFDFCATVDQFAALVESRHDDRPLFASTRSLNLHVAEVRNGYVPPEKTYPPRFERHYAWRVERIDGCFGRFIDALKRAGVYDRSLVVLTADHGELIGEDGRWGHSYHMFPEVIQVPLLVHLPAWVRPTGIDHDAVALSTDITPTIYAALGYMPSASTDLMGHPLFGEDEAQIARRRRDSYVLAASYGAVYAVIRQNGTRLYIADAVNGGDRAYTRGPEREWIEVPVDDGTRMISQLEIRRYVDELAHRYHVERQF